VSVRAEVALRAFAAKPAAAVVSALFALARGRAHGHAHRVFALASGLAPSARAAASVRTAFLVLAFRLAAAHALSVLAALLGLALAALAAAPVRAARLVLAARRALAAHAAVEVHHGFCAPFVPLGRAAIRILLAHAPLNDRIAAAERLLLFAAVTLAGALAAVLLAHQAVFAGVAFPISAARGHVACPALVARNLGHARGVPSRLAAVGIQLAHALRNSGIRAPGHFLHVAALSASTQAAVGHAGKAALFGVAGAVAAWVVRFAPAAFVILDVLNARFIPDVVAAERVIVADAGPGGGVTAAGPGLGLAAVAFACALAAILRAVLARLRSPAEPVAAEVLSSAAVAAAQRLDAVRTRHVPERGAAERVVGADALLYPQVLASRACLRVAAISLTAARAAVLRASLAVIDPFVALAVAAPAGAFAAVLGARFAVFVVVAHIVAAVRLAWSAIFRA